MSPNFGARLMLACALIPGCYRSHEQPADAATRRSDTSTIDPCATPPPVFGCTSWEGEGAPTVLSEPEPVAAHVQFGSGIASDCGVLVAWAVTTRDAAATSVNYKTRTADWSGAPVDAVQPHPALTLDSSSGSEPPRIARGPGGVGALVARVAGCLFVPLGFDGRELGPPSQLTVGTCDGLTGTSIGYSLLVKEPEDAAHTLLSMDATGSITSRAMVTVPSARFVGSRTVFDDGSFLAHSSVWDFDTSRRTSWLQHFDEDGRELAPEVELLETPSRLRAIATPSGALAAWTTAGPGGIPLRIGPIDRDGRPTGETRDAPTEGYTIFEVAIERTPDGDAMLSWLELHDRPTHEARLRVLALAPNGVPRGEPTTIFARTEPLRSLQILVDRSGSRALLLFDDEVGIHAQRLRCVNLSQSDAGTVGGAVEVDQGPPEPSRKVS